MKNKLVMVLVVALSLATFCHAEAQARRDVKPPVQEAGPPLDPSTPLGKVQEIAARLERIEADTAAISAGLEANKIPDFAANITRIMGDTAATRESVAQLGQIATGVDYIANAVETIGETTEAIGSVAESVGAVVDYLQVVATTESVEASAQALETSFLQSAEAQTAALTTAFAAAIESEKAAFAEELTEYRKQAEADASALKTKLETAANIIILLWIALILLLVANVARFVFDRVQQARAAREAQNQEIRELLAANKKKTS